MCARLLRRIPEAEQGRFSRTSARLFDVVVARYGRTLGWVLDHQKGTLAVAVGTLVLTALLYVWVPKGFFPLQDTGVIQGISQAPQSISFSAMAQRQQALARAILEDPAVESLSSFIGVDGTNTTLNSGRMLINLKPLGERHAGIGEVMGRLQGRLQAIPGIRLYMQPVQDLTVETRVSRTQYQFSLQTPSPEELSLWTHRLVDAL
jgi:multidrug efflux pump